MGQNLFVLPVADWYTGGIAWAPAASMFAASNMPIYGACAPLKTGFARSFLSEALVLRSGAFSHTVHDVQKKASWTKFCATA